MQKKYLVLSNLFLIIIAFILPLLWLRSEYLFVPEESNFANYQNIIDKNLFSWNEKENYGTVSSPGDHTLIFPNGIFYKILSEIGLDNHHIQIIFIQFFLLCLLLSISRLLRLFINNNAIILIGSLLYLFNYYFTVVVFYTAKMFQLILLPLFFIFVYRFLKTKNYKYAIYNFITLFFFQAIFCNLPQLVVTFFAYFISISIFILSEKISLLYFFKKYSRSLISFFILLLPIFFYQGLILGLQLYNFNEIKALSTFKAIGAPLYQIFQFRGGWWEYSSYDGIPYNYWLFFYDNIFIILHSYIIFIIIIFSLFLNKMRNSINLVLFLFLLIFIMFASGSSFMPSLYLWFFNNLPPFYIFREPFSKFMPIVLFLVVILLAISLDNIYEKIRNKNIKKLFISGALFLVLVGCVPLFSFNFFDRTNIGWKQTFIKVPSYWKEYSLWSNNNKNSYILPFPFLTEDYELNYKWYSENLGNSNARVYNLFGNSNFIGDYYNQIAPYNKILNIFAEKNNFNFVKLGTVDYLLVQDDVDKTKIQKLIKWESGVKKYFKEDSLKNFSNKLFIHKIKDEYFLPLFYTPLSIISSFSEPMIDSLPEITSSPNYLTRSVVYASGQNSLVPAKLKNISSVFTPLFNSTAKSQKENHLVLNKYQADNIFTLSKTNNYFSPVNVQYSPETKKLYLNSLPIKGISINENAIDVEKKLLLEIPFVVNDFIKIDKNYFSIKNGYNNILNFAEIRNGIEGYQSKIIKKINLKDGSFEGNVWQKLPGDCGGLHGKADLSLRLSKDSTQGLYSLELGSKNHFACVSKSLLVNLKKNKLYKYSFDYKSVKGNEISYYYNLSGKDKHFEFSDSIKVDNREWNHFEIVIEPEEDISTIQLYFYASSDGTQEIVNRYDNIELSEVEMNLINTYTIDQNKLIDNLVIRDDIKLKEGDNIIEYKGNMETDGTLPKDLYNYYLKSNSKEKINTPVIEFKKINPTKYRVIIHHATENFPLVFSESFHDGWKTYLVADKKLALNFNSADYKILDGNLDDQANTEELTNFLNSGYISALGNLKEQNIKHVKWENNREVFAYNEKYKIDFISKNFQDTIQNDNLAPGSFYETWFKKPVADNRNHLMVNGYANSWNINPTELCGAPAGKALCVRNADGSYDLELVVEFWPQRLFYIGLFISGATLLGCLGYLGWDFVKRRRKRKKGES